MHEASLIRGLLRQVESLCREHGGRRVSEIKVQIGPLSGVEPMLLRSAFAQAARTASTYTAELTIEQKLLGLLCETCGARFEVQELAFACPRCGSRQTTVTHGDCLLLEEVVLDDAASGAVP